MAQPHEIEVEIGPDGRVTAHVKGFKGEGCLKVLAEVERLIGRAAAPARPTRERYEKPRVVQRAKQGR